MTKGLGLGAESLYINLALLKLVACGALLIVFILMANPIIHHGILLQDLKMAVFVLPGSILLASVLGWYDCRGQELRFL